MIRSNVAFGTLIATVKIDRNSDFQRLQNALEEKGVSVEKMPAQMMDGNIRYVINSTQNREKEIKGILEGADIKAELFYPKENAGQNPIDDAVNKINRLA